MWYLSALIIGFAGSFHCVAMCGPLIMALPHRNDRFGAFLFKRVLYNLGRIVTYALLGAVTGLFGFAFFKAGLQKELSIAMGILLLIYAIVSSKKASSFISPSATGPVVRLKKAFGSLLQRRDFLSIFMMGVLNGFLPCGFVYLSLVAAATGGDSASSALYMVVFGLGTFPAMLAVAVAGKIASVKMNNLLKRFSPVLIAILAVFLIIRGLTVEKASCCHKHVQHSSQN